jgi:hypothetical protein
LRRAIAAVSSVLFIVAVDGNARDFHLFGQGANSCGAWLSERNTAFANEAWVLGFVTAFNRYGLHEDVNVAPRTDYKGMLAWIDNYCRQNPLTSLAKAAEALVFELQTQSGAR